MSHERIEDTVYALAKAVEANAHACLLANPAEDEMRDLLAKAQINVLPSFNETGIKLKLLNSLYNGRHCVVNDAAVLAEIHHLSHGECFIANSVKTDVSVAPHP